jgi:hypothetical protein
MEDVRGTPKGLAGIGTRGPRLYCPPVRTARSFASSNTFTMHKRISDPTFTAAKNTEASPLREIWRRNLGEDIIRVATRIIHGQGIISLIINRYIFITITNSFIIKP